MISNKELKFKEKWIPKVLNWFDFQERPLSDRGKNKDPLLAPIQSASDLEKLTLQPDELENLFRESNKFVKESGDPSKKQVDSSANWKIFNSLCPIIMPLTLKCLS